MIPLHLTLLVFGSFYAVFVPTVLVLATRRRQWHLIFDLVVTILWTVCLVSFFASPPVIRNIPPFMYAVALGVFVLFGANMFGFSRWLFNRHRKRQI